MIIPVFFLAVYWIMGMILIIGGLAKWRDGEGDYEVSLVLGFGVACAGGSIVLLDRLLKACA